MTYVNTSVIVSGSTLTYTLNAVKMSLIFRVMSELCLWKYLNTKLLYRFGHIFVTIFVIKKLETIL